MNTSLLKLGFSIPFKWERLDLQDQKTGAQLFRGVGFFFSDFHSKDWNAPIEFGESFTKFESEDKLRDLLG